MSIAIPQLDRESAPPDAQHRPPDSRRSLLGMYPEELESLLARLGEPRYRARQLFHWLHRRAEFDLTRMTDLPASLRERLASTQPIAGGEPVRRLQSADGLTAKLLLRLHDGQEIEVVEMNTRPGDERGGRKTIC